MRLIKKISVLAMSAALGLTVLTGCANSGSGSAASGAKIKFIMTDTNDTFRATLTDALTAQAAQQGVSLTMVETGDSIDAQVREVAKAKSEGYDAIICRLADSSTALQMNVESNDLPIIYVNAQPGDDHLKADKYIYVGSDENQAGQFQAEYVLKKLGNPSNMNVIIFEGEQGHSGTIGRTEAVKTTLKANGCNANYVFVDYANWSDKEAQQKFDVFMKTGQSVDAIFCNNDTMALGAVAALKEHGLDYKKIPVTGVDATADGCASIKAGEMSFTVLQDAQGQAAKAITVASLLGKGKSIDDVEGVTDDHKKVMVPFVPVDSSNVNQYAK